MDPNSKPTADARALLEKAISEREAYAALIAGTGDTELDQSK
jgi:hypothetical protein